jgi:hypothetical protein
MTRSAAPRTSPRLCARARSASRAPPPTPAKSRAEDVGGVCADARRAAARARGAQRGSRRASSTSRRRWRCCASAWRAPKAPFDFPAPHFDALVSAYDAFDNGEDVFTDATTLAAREAAHEQVATKLAPALQQASARFAGDASAALAAQLERAQNAVRAQIDAGDDPEIEQAADAEAASAAAHAAGLSLDDASDKQLAAVTAAADKLVPPRVVAALDQWRAAREKERTDERATLALETERRVDALCSPTPSSPRCSRRSSRPGPATPTCRRTRSTRWPTPCAPSTRGARRAPAAAADAGRAHVGGAGRAPRRAAPAQGAPPRSSRSCPRRCSAPLCRSRPTTRCRRRPTPVLPLPRARRRHRVHHVRARQHMRAVQQQVTACPTCGKAVSERVQLRY